MAMVALALWAGWLRLRRRTIYDSYWFLQALVAGSPLGVIAVEAASLGSSTV